MKKLLVIATAFLCNISFLSAQDSSKMHKGMHHDKMMMDCVMMKDGKMHEMKGGKTIDMTKDMTMKNGTMVMSDGNVKMSDGKTMMLKDGDCVMMDGKVKHMGMGKMKMKPKKS